MFPWQIRNDEPWETRHVEIRERRVAGQKSSGITAWLKTHPITGSDGALDGYLNSYPKNSDPLKPAY